MGEIEEKAQLRPAEAEIGVELEITEKHSKLMLWDQPFILLTEESYI